MLIFFSTVETTVADNKDGSYTVSYTAEEPGAYSVWVCVKAQHVKVKPPGWRQVLYCGPAGLPSPGGPTHWDVSSRRVLRSAST